MPTRPSERLFTLVSSNPALLSWLWIQPSEVLERDRLEHPPDATHGSDTLTAPQAESWEQNTWQNWLRQPVDVLAPLRAGINRIDVRRPDRAHFICRTIPTQCPFERDITLFGKRLFHIPPLCKLNPLYDEVVALRFRALCYLADECGEDVTPYC